MHGTTGQGARLDSLRHCAEHGHSWGDFGEWIAPGRMASFDPVRAGASPTDTPLEAYRFRHCVRCKALQRDDRATGDRVFVRAPYGDGFGPAAP